MDSTFDQMPPADSVSVLKQTMWVARAVCDGIHPPRASCARAEWAEHATENNDSVLAKDVPTLERLDKKVNELMGAEDEAAAYYQFGVPGAT